MFLKTIIDETTELTDQEARFASILDFVADDSDNGIFYLFKDWVVRMAGGESTKGIPTRSTKASLLLKARNRSQRRSLEY